MAMFIQPDMHYIETDIDLTVIYFVRFCSMCPFKACSICWITWCVVFRCFSLMERGTPYSHSPNKSNSETSWDYHPQMHSFWKACACLPVVQKRLHPR